jgi:hypothetical protein
MESMSSKRKSPLPPSSELRQRLSRVGQGRAVHMSIADRTTGIHLTDTDANPDSDSDINIVYYFRIVSEYHFLHHISR